MQNRCPQLIAAQSKIGVIDKIQNSSTHPASVGGDFLPQILQPPVEFPHANTLPRIIQIFVPVHPAHFPCTCSSYNYSVCSVSSKSSSPSFPPSLHQGPNNRGADCYYLLKEQEDTGQEQGQQTPKQDKLNFQSIINKPTEGIFNHTCLKRNI